MKKILVTAFEPFLDHKENTSMFILNLLPNHSEHVKLSTCVLPVVYQEAFDQLKTLLDDAIYDGICLLGLAANRKQISFEHIALNIQHTRFSDNKGNAPHHQTIIHDAPMVLKTTVDIHHIPKYFESSYHAGTFVCNELYYRTLHYFENTSKKTKVCFIHVPHHDENHPENNLKTLAKHIETFIQTAF